MVHPDITIPDKAPKQAKKNPAAPILWTPPSIGSAAMTACVSVGMLRVGRCEVFRFVYSGRKEVLNGYVFDSAGKRRYIMSLTVSYVALCLCVDDTQHSDPRQKPR